MSAHTHIYIYMYIYIYIYIYINTHKYTLWLIQCDGFIHRVYWAIWNYVICKPCCSKWVARTRMNNHIVIPHSYCDMRLSVPVLGTCIWDQRPRFLEINMKQIHKTKLHTYGDPVKLYMIFGLLWFNLCELAEFSNSAFSFWSAVPLPAPLLWPIGYDCSIPYGIIHRHIYEEMGTKGFFN